MSTTPEIAAALAALRYGKARPEPLRTGAVRAEMLPTPPDPPPQPGPPPLALPRQKSVETRTIRLRPGSFAKSL